MGHSFPSLVLLHEVPGLFPEVFRYPGIQTIENDGVMHKIDVVAKALGVPEKGDALAARIEADFAALASRVETRSAKPKQLLFVLSARSGTVRVAGKGTPVDAMISLAGGVNVASDLSGYKAMNEEALIMAEPDFILMATYPGSTPPNVEELFALPALSLSPAASNKATAIMDALELTGFGPRTARSALTLHDALYGLR